ncbi:MAG: hypothetical protein GYB31_12145 [Bacteroidetes bacterium]|nr:hypothetical protein [Bacteroidota bacterium]
MNEIKEDKQQRFNTLLEEVREASLNRAQKLQQLISSIDQLTRSMEGITFIYGKMEDLDGIGLFKHSTWEDPKALIPYLVRGTLLAPPPSNVLEIVSELKMLKIACGDYQTDQIDPEQAGNFMEDMLVATFDLAFRSPTENVRIKSTKGDLKRIRLLFDFIIDHYHFPQLKSKLALEVETIAAQRPIITHRLEDLLQLIKDKVDLVPGEKEDERLRYYVDALYHPTRLVRELPDIDTYISQIEKGTETQRRAECQKMGEMLHSTGLVSDHLWAMLRFLSEKDSDLIPELLQLNDHGTVDFERHKAFIIQLIQDCILDTNKQAIYGLKRMLERNLLSRRPVWNALNKLIRINIHPTLKKQIRKSVREHTETEPIKLLVGAAISVLGLPLGLGQGNNPTCQSARGISMWSIQAPGKLLNMIINTAISNHLELRYEGELVESSNLEEKPDAFYAELDPVSIVLVPHLDNIYGQMMQKAMTKHIGYDPHISVNPAFYGHWIQTGFASCYNSLTGAIDQYEQFARTFYASFHPAYNGGYSLVYSVPIGIFITSSKGDLLGFHAISLLRIAKDEKEEWRAYFYNPNNEGRQDWGQGIKPTVSGNGERPGESSLPFYQFLSRVYAFHYNTKGIEDRMDKVPEKELKTIQSLARNSWGKKYIWLPA